MMRWCDGPAAGRRAPNSYLLLSAGSAINREQRTHVHLHNHHTTETQRLIFLPPRDLFCTGSSGHGPLNQTQRGLPHRRREEPARSLALLALCPAPCAAGLPAGRAVALRGGHAPGHGGVRDAADPGRGNAGPLGGGGVSARPGRAGPGECGMLDEVRLR